MTRSQRLTAFVADGARLPFVFGRSCCALWVADWIAAERRLDPAHELRGTFRCHLGSARLQRRAGGLAALVAAPLAALGLVETVSPAIGDVGVVMTKAGEIAGICMGGERWAMKTKDGVAVVPAVLLKGWIV